MPQEEQIVAPHRSSVLKLDVSLAFKASLDLILLASLRLVPYNSLPRLEGKARRVKQYS